MKYKTLYLEGKEGELSNDEIHVAEDFTLPLIALPMGKNFLQINSIDGHTRLIAVDSITCLTLDNEIKTEES